MRFRYSLRTLLLLTITAGVGIGTYLKWTENERSIAAIQGANGHYFWITRQSNIFGGPGPEWPEAEHYARVDIDETWEGDASSFNALRGLRRLKSLDLTLPPPANGRLYQVLPGLPELESIWIRARVGMDEGPVVFSDESVEALTRCRQLRALTIVGFLKSSDVYQITPPAQVLLDRPLIQTFNGQLKRLQACPQLRTLTLSGDLVDAQTGEVLSGFTKLECLELFTNPLPLAELKPLSRLAALQALKVPLETAPESTFPWPPNLVALRLFGPAEEPVEPETFARLTKMQTLEIGFGSVPDDFVARLEKLKLPALRRIVFPIRRFAALHEYVRDARSRFQPTRTGDVLSPDWPPRD